MLSRVVLQKLTYVSVVFTASVIRTVIFKPLKYFKIASPDSGVKTALHPCLLLCKRKTTAFRITDYFATECIHNAK
jgi:hypothetical protein